MKALKALFIFLIASMIFIGCDEKITDPRDDNGNGPGEPIDQQSLENE